jgi:hypothetical protein
MLKFCPYSTRCDLPHLGLFHHVPPLLPSLFLIVFFLPRSLSPVKCSWPSGEWTSRFSLPSSIPGTLLLTTATETETATATYQRVCVDSSAKGAFRVCRTGRTSSACAEVYAPVWLHKIGPASALTHCAISFTEAIRAPGGHGHTQLQLRTEAR